MAKKALIRSAVVAELTKRGKSQYWLAHQVGMHPNEVNRALSPFHDMRVSTAEKMLNFLNLTVSSKGR